MYYIFNSHNRNNFGQFSESGSADLLQFSSMSSVVCYLNSMYSGAYFNISPVILQYDGHTQIDQSTNNEVCMNAIRTENTTNMHFSASPDV